MEEKDDSEMNKRRKARVLRPRQLLSPDLKWSGSRAEEMYPVMLSCLRPTSASRAPRRVEAVRGRLPLDERTRVVIEAKWCW